VRAGVSAASAARLLTRALASRMLTTQTLPPRTSSGEASAAAHGATVIAAGKAADAMMRAYLATGAPLARGLVATTHASDTGEGLPASVRVYLAGHPLPTTTSEAAGREALRLAAASRADEPLVLLLSGGASALLAAPAEGLTLADKIDATQALLRGGAAIHELNAIRKHLSAVKGGRLAAHANGPIETYALSDVVGPVEDDPSVIGSGPTVPDDTTFADAFHALERLHLLDRVPAAVVAYLTRGRDGREAETPKPGDARLARARFTLIGGRRDAMDGARVEAERRGYRVAVIDAPVVGEAREAASRCLRTARRIRDERGGPCCVISSGETTVTVRGRGVGGRNQELALAMALDMTDEDERITAASVGTDGIDGPTDAAGAWVDPSTRRRAAAAGVDLAAALAENDSFRAFDRLGDAIRTGRTDTNVGDLQIVLLG